MATKALTAIRSVLGGHPVADGSTGGHHLRLSGECPGRDRPRVDCRGWPAFVLPSHWFHHAGAADGVGTRRARRPTPVRDDAAPHVPVPVRNCGCGNHPGELEIEREQRHCAAIIPATAVLGAPDPQARVLTDAILDWRKAPEQGGGLFDGVPGIVFSGPACVIPTSEELLLVRGMTPELFYGCWMDLGPDGSRIWHSGLRDCVITLAARNVLRRKHRCAAAVGFLGAAPASIQQPPLWRNRTPIHAVTDVANLFPEEVMTHLTVGGGVALTLRATARVRLPNGGFSDLKRTVSWRW